MKARKFSETKSWLVAGIGLVILMGIIYLWVLSTLTVMFGGV